MFIAFEGIDGCGKTTQLEKLANRLAADSIPYVCCKAIGGTPLGAEVRKVFLHGPQMNPLSELLLMAACVSQMMEEVIKPALEAGQWVLCDRWFISAIAYQGYGGGLPIDYIEQVRKLVTRHIDPDIIVYLQTPLDVCLQRTQERKTTDRIEKMGTDFFKRVEKGFDSQANFFSHHIKTVNGAQNQTTVARQIWDVIQAFTPV
jgi:dTMP kinase